MEEFRVACFCDQNVIWLKEIPPLSNEENLKVTVYLPIYAYFVRRIDCRFFN